MSSNKRLYMETTSISPEKTVAEITSVLVAAGATQIYNRYENRRIIGLSFTLDVDGKIVPFCLPVRSPSIAQILQKRRSPSTRTRYEATDNEQADRIAWRQLLRWVQAQVAMIDTGMVRNVEVFMPYIEMTPGVTLFQRLVESGRLLTAGE